MVAPCWNAVPPVLSPALGKTAQINCTLGNRSSGRSGTAIASPAEYALDEVSGEGVISHAHTLAR